MTDRSVRVVPVDHSPKPRRAPAIPPEERAELILDAARAVFLEKGFAAARMDDVAARARVAKGTLYLHFESKEALFKALVASVATPPVEHMEALLRDDRVESAELLRQAMGILVREILTTDRRFVLRLLLVEGHKFPEVMRFYHEAVISRAMRLISGIARRGVERGEFRHDALARFPQLLAAPMILAVLWEGLFEEVEPLDVEGLLRAQLDLLLRGLGAER